MSVYLKFLLSAIMVLVISGCSMDEKVKSQANTTISKVTTMKTKLAQVDELAKKNPSFATFLTYYIYNPTATLNSLDKGSQQLEKFLKEDSSSNEKTVQKIISDMNVKLSSKELVKRSNSIQEFENMKKNSGKYLSDIENLIKTTENQSNDSNSKQSIAMKRIDELSKEYANKDGYFQSKKDTILGTTDELKAYLTVAQDADMNKDFDIEALISLKNIKDNAQVVYDNYVSTIESVESDAKSLNSVHKKTVIDKKITPKYYVFYIPTYMLDSYSNPEPRSKSISSHYYRQYSNDLLIGRDVQVINGSDAVVVGFDTVNTYFLKFQTSIDGVKSEPKWIEVDEATYNEMNSHMKRFNSNHIVVEYKGKGQFEGEMSTIPYPEEYGPAYTYVGNPAYGSWVGTGADRHWSFTDVVLAGLVGHAILGNNYNSRSYYRESDFLRNRDYYRNSGYGYHYDRYDSYDYNRQYGNYTRKSKTYLTVKKEKQSYSLKDKVVVSKKAPVVNKPTTPKGFTGTKGRVSSSQTSKNGVNYKSFAKAKKPTISSKETTVGNSKSVTSSKPTKGFMMPSKRISNSATSKSGAKYISKAKAIKPVTKKPEYDFKKRLASNSELQKRIATQTKKRISHVKSSDKYKKAKEARIAKAKAKKLAEEKKKRDAEMKRIKSEKAKKARLAKQRRDAAKKAKARKSSSSSKKRK